VTLYSAADCGVKNTNMLISRLRAGRNLEVVEEFVYVYAVRFSVNDLFRSKQSIHRHGLAAKIKE